MYIVPLLNTKNFTANPPRSSAELNVIGKIGTSLH